MYSGDHVSGVLKLDPIGLNAALQLDLKVALPIIDQLLGGEGKGMAATREITEIEEQILDRSPVSFAANWAQPGRR